MKLQPLGRKRSTVLAITTATATAAALVGAGSLVWAEDAGLGTENYGAGEYIVQVAGEPVATYDGGITGYDATAAQDGERVDTDTKDANRYRDYLAELRDDVLGQVPGADTLYEYDTVMNGFTVQLSASEAKKMANADGVLRMWRNEVQKLDTSNTPDFLGLTGDNGVWEEQYGGSENAGEGVIVGIVDTGFWPENPSFAELPEPRPDQDIIDEKWNGTCDAGAGGSADENVTCNNKVIGARYYNFGDAPTDEGEFNSPRDFGGHGSHTASTAAGNHGVDTGEFGVVSGMAPSARLSIYKVCWETSGGCGTANSVAAIEDAVNDGVDVLNFSISGSPTYIVDPVQIAFFNAAAAGVFVANSAGNAGPGASTSNHNSPWVTTVAASSHDRDFEATITLGNGESHTGAGRGADVASTGAVLSTEVGKDGADPTAVAQCHLGSLDEAKVAGRIVACARGAVALVDKSAAVAEAGGSGLILFNVAGGASSTLAVQHAVPTIHIGATEGEAVVAYLAADDATAALGAGVQISAKAPVMADFSSTGPALAGGGDLLKPDITAPGVDVIAAVAPPGNGGADFASYQGTSMSSPHIAGLGALLKAKNPDWSPSAIRSAMMTTASQTDNEGDPITRHDGSEASPFSYGSGHVTPTDMFDPGLVYDSEPSQWLQYGCAIGQFQLIGYQDLCDSVEAIDPSDLNYPSIAIGDLAGSQKVTRTVTNVSSKTSTYFPIVDAPEGVKVKVNKKALSIKPGKSATFTITFTRTDANFNEYAFGSLTWKDLNGHEVRSPLAIQPVSLATADELHSEGASGELALTGVAGYNGTLNAEVAGLVAPELDEFSLENPTGDSFDPGAPAENDHVKAVEITVPEDAELSRFATFNSDYANGVDLDLFAFQKVGDNLYYLGSSAAGGSDESVTLPGGATYVIYVDFFGGAPTVDVKLNSWIVGGDEGNVTLAPSSQNVKISKSFKADLSWADLAAGTHYLGAVIYTDGNGEYLDSTIVNVTT